MLLPYASTENYAEPNKKQPIPLMTFALLFVTVIVAIVFELAGRGGGSQSQGQFLSAFGLVPNAVTPFALFTYPFLHAGMGHLLLNMFYLFVFGSGIEAEVGQIKLLAFYLLGGAVGGAMQIIVTRYYLPSQSGIPIVGASAACSALIGLYANRYYRARLVFVGIPFKPQVVAVVLFILTNELLWGLYSLYVGNELDGIAHWAHLGGFTFGLGCAFFLKLYRVGELSYLRRDATINMNYSEPGEAIKRWRTVLSREPNNPVAHAEIAKAWLLLGDTEQAEPYALHSIELSLKNGNRHAAALLFVEMREQGGRALPPANELFLIGNTLEELEEYALAAETLRAVTIHNPDAPEAETALLKVAQLYLNHLNRHDEAAILLRLFQERYAHSPLCRLAEEMQRTLGTSHTGY